MAICALVVAGCGNEDECAPDSGFHKLFENGNRPTNKEAMAHITCTDSEGNRY